jgi:hypothetical protein
MGGDVPGHRPEPPGRWQPTTEGPKIAGRDACLALDPGNLKQWATVTGASENEVLRLLLNIQTYANFKPKQGVPGGLVAGHAQ